MNVAQFLAELNLAGVKLSVNGESLQYDAPVGALTPELHKELRRRKPEILQFLRSAEDVSGSQTPPLVPKSRPRELPLSFAQQRLWFLHQLQPEVPAYNIPRVARIYGPLDLQALRRALTAVRERHEALRTCFPNVEGIPRQVIQPASPPAVSVVQLPPLPPDAADADIRRRARQEALTAFDLARGPLMRATLLRRAPEDHVFLLTLHHIVADGWSVDILFRELAILYEAFSKGRSSPLPPLPIQYADYALWQRRWLRGKILEKQASYWKGKLATRPVLDLPADRPRPVVVSMRGGHESFALPDELSRDLRDLAQRESATLFMTLLAAFGVLLHRYSNQESLLIGSHIANRNRQEVEGLIGFFANTLVLHTDLSGRPSFVELLRRVRHTALEAYDHQDLPFEKLVDELDPQRDLSLNPLVQVTFAFQNAPSQPLELPPLRVVPLEVDNGTAKFDLSLSMQRDGQRLSGTMAYSTDLFQAATIRRMNRHFQTLLENIVSDPNQPISTLKLMRSAEQHALLVKWNKTAREEPNPSGIHEWFEAQVERAPAADAVLAEEGRLSYEELNQRANQLACVLRDLGVGPEKLVGVCMQRSLDMLVAILGTLKAGGAYVPLDPAYPEQRLALMLEDSRALVVLTDQRSCSRLPHCEATVLLLDAGREAMARSSGRNRLSGVAAHSLAYLIYTSGSTGRPKGVAIEHRSASALIQWAGDVFSAEELAGVLFSTSICFDLSIFEMFVPLSYGGSVILADNALHLPTLRTANRVTLINTVPSAMVELLRSGGLPDSVRIVNLAGEPLTVELVRQIYQQPSVEKVYDLFGPSEDTTYSTYALRRPDGPYTIGRPIANTQAYLLDAAMNPVPVGVPGEMYLGGSGLARGYYHAPEQTAAKFVPNPFADKGGARLYRTGDLAKYLPDGNIEFLGRMDHQVKVRGYRIELGEIEAVLSRHLATREVVVVARETAAGDPQLVAYLACVSPRSQPPISQLRAHVKKMLPNYMVPAAFVLLDALPRTPNGKIDRAALPRPERPAEASCVAPRSDSEKRIAAVWRDVLGTEQVGVRDNFFDLGGNSLLLVRVHAKLQPQYTDLKLVDLFRYPTVESLTGYLEGMVRPVDLDHAARTRVSRRTGASEGRRPIAIVAMAGRFPGAQDLTAFWSNLRGGVETIRFFTDEQLRGAGIEPKVIEQPGYVKAKAVLDGVDLFDASLFGYSPREAELIDPQQRLFLECSWQALEHAGYDPQRYEGLIGVYAGSSMNSYLANVHSRPDLCRAAGRMQIALANDKDHLPTRVSYKLGLRGPSVNIQTACSTSLVAVHEACRSLLDHECDMALAGGVSVSVPVISGYTYQEEGILSPDGHCRPFDSRAQGTVAGNAVGVVVMKRLEEALDDGDVIHAVILGSAINNDGSLKVGYTAPSVEGQARVITLALAAGHVEASTIGYIETHGTGTPLGDPIEVAALKEAFGTHGGPRGSCGLGSVKSNFGHVDAAAGVAGLIKTILCLKHRELVPSLNCERPSPKIDLDHSPFYVNTELRRWTAKHGQPRRAGVSSFGMGGTNAHVVLEEAPARKAAGPSRPWQLLMMSAKTARALDAASANLAEHLKHNGQLNLADVAYTLQVGRQQFEHRRAVVCRDVDEGVAALEQTRPGRSWKGIVTKKPRPVVFMFPGQGSQYVNMGRELYRRERVFRQVVEACCRQLEPHLDHDLREFLYPQPSGDRRDTGLDEQEASQRLRQTSVTQPALFVVELALARLWMSWGIEPSALIGHSIGEYVAACLAGVLSQEEALRLVALRGQLMEQAPTGSMLAVPLSPERLEERLGEGAWISAVNSPTMCVVSGYHDRIEALERRLRQEEIGCRRLHTSHAFHSPLMDGVPGPLIAAITEMGLAPPKIPCISNVTGRWITERQACDPGYWGRQLREPVRFSDGVATLLQHEDSVYLEVGPGNALTTLLRQQAPGKSPAAGVSSLRHPREKTSDGETMARALGQLWLAGAEVAWRDYYAQERRHRVELPTYPFQRKRFWVEPERKGQLHRPPSGHRKRADIGDWFYAPLWKQLPPAPRGGLRETERPRQRWLVFTDPLGVGAEIARRLESNGQDVTRVSAGDRFREKCPKHYTIDPCVPGDYEALVKALETRGAMPERVVHAWLVTDPAASEPNDEPIKQLMDIGFYSLLYLVQALPAAGHDHALHLHVISDRMQPVTGEEALCPEKAMALGLCRVIPQEQPHVHCTSIDLAWPVSRPAAQRKILDRLTADLLTGNAGAVTAYRGANRWTQYFEPVRLEAAPSRGTRLRPKGVYVITGGLGDVGLTLGEFLARRVQARLVLVGRRAFPPRESWDHWQATHPDDDMVSSAIRRVQQIEHVGGEVLVAEADVADEAHLRTVFREAEARFQTVHGLVHAAGVVRGATFSPVHRLDRSECEEQFRPKIGGLMTLARVLEGRKLDFCLLMSSLSSVLGGLGFGAYAAANAFMDAFAQAPANSHDLPWISVGWDGWKVRARQGDRTWGGAEASVARFAMLPEEAVEAFHRIVARADTGRIVVSTGDLQSRLAQWTVLETATSDQPPESTVSLPTHGRPDLSTDYIAPRNATEASICRMWEELLGIDGIGVGDNFFELGGHSLLAVQLVHQAKSSLGIDVPVHALFERPTVEQFAALAEQHQRGRQQDGAGVAETLAMVENLSDEEVRELLARDNAVRDRSRS